jgi:hypothetical protein
MSDRWVARILLQLDILLGDPASSHYQAALAAAAGLCAGGSVDRGDATAHLVNVLKLANRILRHEMWAPVQASPSGVGGIRLDKCIMQGEYFGEGELRRIIHCLSTGTSG